MSLINYSFLFGVLIRDKPKIDFELNFNFYEYLNKSCDNEPKTFFCWWLQMVLLQSNSCL